MYEDNGNQIPKLESIDAETLMVTPFKRKKTIVEGLIPRGLTILSGASKAGKSWMVLWMALQIVKGQDVWGQKTQQCGVLYISLEDTLDRLQDRIFQLSPEPPHGLRLSVNSGTIGSGLEEQIYNHLAEYPETGLVIIDTLQKVRAQHSSNTNAYAADYGDVAALKSIADEMGVAILLVHHLRKMKDSADPFNEISGSTGLMGASDATLILKRERGENTAKLIATGRDIENQEYKLVLDSEKFLWQLQERKGPDKLKLDKVPPFVFKIADFMRKELAWDGTATELLERIGDTKTSSKVVSSALARYSDEILEPRGITYSSRRTKKSRIISLLCMPPDIYNPDGSYVNP